jgi:hypothetical protein
MLRKLYLSIALITLCTASSQTYGFLTKKKSTLDRTQEYAKNNPKKTLAFVGTSALVIYCGIYAWNKGFNDLGAHLIDNVIGQGIANPTLSFMHYYDVLLRVYKGAEIKVNGTKFNPWISAPSAALGATAHLIGTYILAKKGINWYMGR